MPDIKETLIDLLTGYSLDTYEDVQYVADELIAKGVLPVVRCKDCLYWQSGENECEKWEYCTFHNIGIGPHSFCSYGERKDGD